MTDAQQTIQVPTKRAKDVAEGAKQPTLRDGTYRLLVTGPANFRPGYGPEGAHKLEISFPVAPLNNPQDANSVFKALGFFTKIVAPYGIGVDSPAIDQKAQRKTVTFLNSVFGDEVVPPWPRFTRGPEGEKAVEACLDAATAKIVELQANPGMCVNWAVDAKVGTFEPTPGKKIKTAQFYTDKEIAGKADWAYDKPRSE